MKVMVQDGCISCGLCTEEYPDLFHMNEDGLAEAVGEVPAGREGDAQQASEECPVGVIKVSS